MKIFTVLLSLIMPTISLLLGEVKPWILDLTQTKLHYPEKQWYGAGLYFREGGVNQTLFEVKLVQLDKESYRYGDTITYECALKNTTLIPQIFPCLQGEMPKNTERSLPAPKGYRQFVFTLRIRKDNNDSDYINYTWLFGSEEVPGSTRLLQPGETIIIRQSGVWNPPPYACRPNTDGFPAKARVFASLSARYLKPLQANTKTWLLDSNEVLVGCKP